MTVELRKMADTSHFMWLLERLINVTFEIQFQNQPGALPEIPDMDISKIWRDLCDCSHEGKLGPILIELMKAESSWKGRSEERRVGKECT